MKFGLTGDVWLDVPQAVVLEATRDIDRAVGLTAETTALLLIKASSLLARRTEIPLAADADEEQRFDALRKIREARTAMAADSHYLEAACCGGEDQSEEDARRAIRKRGPRRIHSDRASGSRCDRQRTGTVMLFDLRIDAVNLTEALTGKPIRAASTASYPAADEMQEQSSQDFQKWECTGDPVPKLIDWARSRWGEGSQALPNRFELLEVFRGQFGRVLGINEKTMREVRRHLASREARRGGAATHRR